MRRRRFFHPSSRLEVAGLLLIVHGLFACAKLPGLSEPDERQAWARQVLSTMSLEEKVGQMILAGADGTFLNENHPNLVELVEGVREERIGGVVFFQGDPWATAALANRLQDEAAIPLLMASDYEWGAAFRVEGATRFPSALAVAAGGDEEDAAFQAEVTAREARAMGIHLALAPVVDLNVNPASSVINNRSFGEDPERVGRLAAAFIRRAQQRGLLTTVKHFPGHGATAADSHITLPVVHVDRQRLEDVELRPFRAAIEAGVAAVMVAHMAVPALDGRSDRPATFSPEIVEGVLREQMGFTGLVLSDALDMEGARQSGWGGRVAVFALQAGCDLLLVPPDPRVAWDAVCRAVRQGTIASEQIDRSVLRILDAKARLNLHRERTVDLRDIPRRVGDPRFEEKVQQIADRSITLVEHPSAILPLSAEKPPRILLVSYGVDTDRALDPTVLVEELEARTESVTHVPIAATNAAWGTERLARLAEDTDLVVLASFVRAGYSRPSETASGLVAVIEDWRRQGVPVVVVNLGNPYELTELVAGGGVTYLIAYDHSPLSQRAVARALFGEIAIGGRLPVTLSERYPAGHGIDLKRRALELSEVVDNPGEVGISKKGLENVQELLRKAVASKAFPGGVAVVGRRGKCVMNYPFGHLNYADNAPPVRLDTLYDLASLTKVVATTTLAMILTERGELNLERPVRDYIPEFNGGDKDRVTVADLLAHSGGLLWWKDLYRDYGDLAPKEAKEKLLGEIYRMPLDYEPRSKSVYSDLGILLLGEILERISGRSLDRSTQEEIFVPLGMGDTMFRPPASLISRVAPTEADSWRRKVVQGEVHDENAYALGGVAAHAGLFSTGPDLARFAQMLLNGGIYGSQRILRRSTIKRFTRRAERVPESSRALGWDTPSPDSSSGRYFSASSFGHTGFTGTSLWIDPEREIFAILLTNRVHPNRENEQIREVRPAFHDAVMQALVDVEVNPREP